jgi:hypothetical protein
MAYFLISAISQPSINWLLLLPLQRLMISQSMNAFLKPGSHSWLFHFSQYPHLKTTPNNGSFISFPSSLPLSAGFKLMILLPLPPEFWDYRYEPPHPALLYSWLQFFLYISIVSALLQALLISCLNHSNSFLNDLPCNLKSVLQTHLSTLLPEEFTENESLLILLPFHLKPIRFSHSPKFKFLTMWILHLSPV